MHPNDIKLARLSSNLLRLTEQVAAFSDSEAKRYSQGVTDARAAASMAAQIEPTGKERGRAAVVSWDLGHNPAGRAYVLYQLLSENWDVDLIGPMWSRYGTQMWAPLRNSDLNVRSFHCSDFSEFVPKAEALACGQHYDVVYVCKPRLPSLYLGALIKEACDCPLILDVDDFELSFFNDQRNASVKDLRDDIHAALHEPFEELATRYSQSLVCTADAITVSNVALRSRFGGHMVRHARDEVQFDNSAELRQAARDRLGILSSDFALVFIGTPRPHKGILHVAKALDALGDDNIVFHIVGTVADSNLKQQLLNFPNARVVLHPDCAFEELPKLLAGADLVPLIQDVSHAISKYQIPAKVSDALSLGIPVIATRTPPLVDLIASGAVRETSIDDLKDNIQIIKQSVLDKKVSAEHPKINMERRMFLGEFSLSINRVRVEQAIKEAKENILLRSETTKNVRSLFTGKRPAADAPVLPQALADMIDIIRKHYKGLRGEELRCAKERRGELASPRVVSKSLLGFPGILSARALSYDIAFFWKQNDSRIYGRRSDMIAKELIRSGRVRKMLHLDAPISTQALNQQFIEPRLVKNGQQSLIMSNLIDRQMGIYDTDTIRNRTYVFNSQAEPARLLGQDVWKSGSYVRYVNEQLEAHGMRARNTVAWFCPVISHASELVEKIGFGGIVSDLIDDERTWDNVPEEKARLDNCYRDTLAASDLVFANCDTLAESMQMYTGTRINVVPNGAERFDRFPDASKPVSMQNINGPVVGYVGNLRDRIDWTLLHEVVPAMPDVSFVFFGPSNDNPNADSLALHDNVHVMGVVPYQELAFHLKAFDVALLPHIHNQLTERMNPLKVYNYFAAGLPIVSSEVANLEIPGCVLKTATTATEFIKAIRDSLANPVDTRTTQWQSTMDVIAWESRVTTILDNMDQSLHRKLRRSA